MPGNHINVAELTPDLVKWLTVPQLRKFTPAQWRDFFKAGLQAYLTKTQVRAIPKARIPSLDVAGFEKRVSMLTGEQIEMITLPQWDALCKAGLLSHFTKDQIRAIPDPIIPSLDMGGLEPRQISGLGKKIAKLTRGQLDTLTIHHVEAITLPQIDAMTATQFREISAGTFRKFTPKQFERMSDDQTDALSVLQLTTSRATHKKRLTPEQAAKLDAALKNARKREFIQALLTFSTFAVVSVAARTALPESWVVDVAAAATATRGLAVGTQAVLIEATEPDTRTGRAVRGVVATTQLITAPGAFLGLWNAVDLLRNVPFAIATTIGSTKTAQEAVTGRTALRNEAEHLAGPLSITGCAVLTWQSWPSPGFTTAASLFTFGSACFWGAAIRQDLANRRPVPRSAADIGAAEKADARWEMSGRIILGVTISFGSVLMAWSALANQSEENDKADSDDDALPTPDSSPDVPPISEPPPEQFPQLVVLAEDGLNLRAQPAIDSDKVTVLEPGTFVDQTGKPSTDASGQAWIPVAGFATNGSRNEGWVAAEFVTAHPEGASGPEGRTNPKLERGGYQWVEAQDGDSIGRIAKANAADVAATVMLNMDHILDPALVFPGDRIYLPAVQENWKLAS